MFAATVQPFTKFQELKMNIFILPLSFFGKKVVYTLVQPSEGKKS